MISTLLQKLLSEQKSGIQKGYLDGIFPSQRFHSFFGFTREDENVFFSSTIAFQLQNLKAQFNTTQKEIAEKICTDIIKNYPYFKNFKGRNTYNFFKTNPMDFFPNGNIMHRFKFFKLADDIDDTAYIYLTGNFSEKEHTELSELLKAYANGKKKYNTHHPYMYRNINCYGIYFGEKMLIELDACVLTNILLWKTQNHLEFEKIDWNSVDYLIKCVSSKDYLKYPYLVSPCYPSTSQICYHIARLIHFTNITPLKILKNEIITDIKALLKQHTHFRDRLFLNLSLLYLDYNKVEKLEYHLDDVKNTSLFYTAIPLMIGKLWVRKLFKYKWTHFFGLRTRCNGYILSLLLEYEMLFNKKRA